MRLCGPSMLLLAKFVFTLRIYIETAWRFDLACLIHINVGSPDVGEGLGCESEVEGLGGEVTKAVLFEVRVRSPKTSAHFLFGRALYYGLRVKHRGHVGTTILALQK